MDARQFGEVRRYSLEVGGVRQVMKASTDIRLYRGRVDGEFGQMRAKLGPGLSKNFEPVSGPRPDLFNLDFAPGDGLAKVKVGKRRLELRKGSFNFCEAGKDVVVKGSECSRRGRRREVERV